MPFQAWLSVFVLLAIGSGVVASPSRIVKHAEYSDTASSCAASMNGALPSPTALGFQYSGTVRRYYIAAEEVQWDYAPTGWDNWLGVPFNLSPRAQQAGAVTHGTKWLKALYRGYTDSTFRTLLEVPSWQGTLGPTIRSEVGDMIEILFVNKLTENYATMHSMGLAYTKTNEGADYPNNTSPTGPGVTATLPETGAVPPGGCVVYKWLVDAAAGPQNNEPAKAHSYHSYVTYQEDTNAGLIGPQIVYAAGRMNATMAGAREIPLLFMIYEESNSWLSGKNAAALQSNDPSSHGGPGQQYGPPSSAGGPTASSSSLNTVSLYPGNYSYWHPQLVNLAGSNQFVSAPAFFTLNGYIFANNPTFDMCLGDQVIWYTMAYGSASHVFHMHGNSVSYNGIDQPSASINDGAMKTLYMNATGQGMWQVICHVGYHHSLGMVANYRVYGGQSGTAQCPLPALVASTGYPTDP